MRWREFSRMSRGQRVVWMPTGERGVVIRSSIRCPWIRWDSGRIDKLDVNEDSYHLVHDKRANEPELSIIELERRRTNARIRPHQIEDGSPEELELVYREAQAIRAERECPTKRIEPSSVPMMRGEANAR